ncbi:MAG: CCA tRNA nucleotidyltransferase [Chloroflexota bacterium]
MAEQHPAAGPPFPVEPHAQAVLERLWDAGHAGWLVGGAVRDALLGRPTHDWDVATDALPETILGLFPHGTYENRFGTVLARGVEITTFRRDQHYPDHRRPAAVTFTDSLEEDLLRRDFTVNAIAWGRPAGGGAGSSGFADPAGGRADLAAGILRAVGDPALRFDEDALRLLRAARIAAAVGLAIDPGTHAAMAAHADDVRWVSGERIGIELRRMLEAPEPSRAFRLLAETGLLRPTFPELAAQIGVPQAKVPWRDCWDHTLAALDAAARAAPGDELLLVTVLFHDAGKPATMEGGHFHGHEVVGAVFAEERLARLAWPRHEIRRVARAIRAHMFRYTPDWTDAAVRRFIRRTGPDILALVFALRRADDAGSGEAAPDPGLTELMARTAAQIAAGMPLTTRDLAVDGHDLQAALGREPGPWLGELMDRLLDAVTNDPTRNTAAQLIADARSWTSADAPTRDAGPAAGRGTLEE